jgi:hypothetical protein
MTEGLNTTQIREVEQLSELAIRRYFDHFLLEIWPQQQAALMASVAQSVAMHDADDQAHGRVEMKFNRVFWVLMGVSAASGVGLASVTRLLLFGT